MGGGPFPGQSSIRYGLIEDASEIVFDEKSHYYFKKGLVVHLPDTLFFTEHKRREPEPPAKGAVVVLRSCDLNALERLDDIYLRNGPEDYYYKLIRDNIKFVLMECAESFENCFCVSLSTQSAEAYHMCVNFRDSVYQIECQDAAWNEYFLNLGCEIRSVRPDQVRENHISVTIPTNLGLELAKSRLWEQYNKRCINYGRCTFVCPTCSCYTMQDLHYSENAMRGERRRLWASCKVDDFTDVAG